LGVLEGVLVVKEYEEEEEEEEVRRMQACR
jgi:hypothetical protein